MPNVQGFSPGDLLVFQVESGYGLMRVLGLEESDADIVWHLRVYRELFPAIEYAELAIDSPGALSVDISHIALTDRAFESTQVSKLGNYALNDEEQASVASWEGQASDRSIRLLLGLR